MAVNVRGRAPALALVLGSACSGVLAYVFFAQVTRTLGAEAAAPVSVLWTWWSFAAAGLTFPLQHWASRTIAAHDGGEGAVRRDLPRVALVVLGVALLSGGLTWLARDQLFSREDAWFPCLVGLVTVGSAVVGMVRGILNARHRLLAVASTLVLENLARVALAAALAASGDPGAMAFGLALLAGQVLVLVWPSAWRLGRRGAERDHGAWLGFLGGAAGGQLMAQLVLTGGPAVLALGGGAAAQVTALFAVLALFRAPYTLAVGAVVPVTTWLTRQMVAGREGVLRRYAIVVTGLAIVAVAVAWPVGQYLGPWLVRVVFGDEVVVAPGVSALVASGSALALGTLALSLLTLARGSAGRMTLAWGVALPVALAVVLAAPAEPVVAVALAFVAAEATAFLGLLPWSRLRRT